VSHSRIAQGIKNTSSDSVYLNGAEKSEIRPLVLQTQDTWIHCPSTQGNVNIYDHSGDTQITMLQAKGSS
jgi:ferric-dicitrate binding protein FerR (iron transport regulator)